jgi:hypothetical protein
MKSSIFGTLIVGMALLMVGCASTPSESRVALNECNKELESPQHEWALRKMSKGAITPVSLNDTSYPTPEELKLLSDTAELHAECFEYVLRVVKEESGTEQWIIAHSTATQLASIQSQLLSGNITYGEYYALAQALAVQEAEGIAKSERLTSDQRHAEKAAIMEESEQKSLACISAGGRPIYDRRYDLIGDSEQVYERCVANVQQAPQSQPTWDLTKGIEPPEPIVFEPRDRGQRCNTSCSSYGNCTTTCSPR